MKTQNKKNKRLANCVIIIGDKEFEYMTLYEYIYQFCKYYEIPHSPLYSTSDGYLDKFYLYPVPVYLDLKGSPNYSFMKICIKHKHGDVIKFFKEFIRDYKCIPRYTPNIDYVLINYKVGKSIHPIWNRIHRNCFKTFLAKMIRLKYMEKEEALKWLRVIKSKKDTEVIVDLSGYKHFFQELRGKKEADKVCEEIISNIRGIVKELNNENAE